MADIRSKKQDDEMMQQITGGKSVSTSSTRRSECPVCKKETTFDLYSGGRAVCRECGYEKFM